MSSEEYYKIIIIAQEAGAQSFRFYNEFVASTVNVSLQESEICVVEATLLVAE